MVGLQCMIDICVKYDKVFGITFNSLKSIIVKLFIPYSRNSFCPRINLIFNYRSLDWVKKILYLGITMLQSILIVFLYKYTAD